MKKNWKPTGFNSLNRKDYVIELKYLGKSIRKQRNRKKQKRKIRKLRAQYWITDLNIFNFTTKRKVYKSLKCLQVISEKCFCRVITDGTQVKGGPRQWVKQLERQLQNDVGSCHGKRFCRTQQNFASPTKIINKPPAMYLWVSI